MRALLVSLSMVAAPALADVTYEYGQCRFGEAANGTYYESHQPHTNYLTPRCASVGVSFKWPKLWIGKDMGIRAAFLVSGSVEARDNLAQMNDGIHDPRPCSSDHWANCHSLFGGSGRMRGIQVSITKETSLGGRWWAQAEAGALFFEHYFNGYAKPQDFDGARLVNAGAVQGTAIKWEGGGLDQESALWNAPLPMVGATIGYGPAYFAARYHFEKSRVGLSITDHSMLQFMGGMRF